MIADGRITDSGTNQNQPLGSQAAKPSNPATKQSNNRGAGATAQTNQNRFEAVAGMMCFRLVPGLLWLLQNCFYAAAARVPAFACLSRFIDQVLACRLLDGFSVSGLQLLGCSVVVCMLVVVLPFGVILVAAAGLVAGLLRSWTVVAAQLADGLLGCWVAAKVAYAALQSCAWAARQVHNGAVTNPKHLDNQ